ncbi:serine hydrolase domain-containing protein [Calycomorphotria hydatis]|uniref:Penicillin-binding protein PbpX n=1 Tax=Calycomorphotria hydatis TaxID=2528027 RepID=A0A517TC36_9PLAN|nr:serine hydrolase domain-containing protein [Calycomorphotria hydatis]QDT65930.1 Putative penicillin-binding protein PbpX [Calycomorphotria hydatis]
MSLDAIAVTFPQTAAMIQDGIDSGLHTGGQIFVSREGEVIIDEPFGDDQPGQPMQPVHRMCWLSAGKPITAFVIAQLVEKGKLTYSQRVAEIIPEFATGGKDPITVEQLLTHTCGFRHIDTGYPTATWEESLQLVCGAPLEDEWEPGKTAGYHRASSWFVLGELVQRVDGRPVADYLREMILEPIGATSSAISYTHDEWEREHSEFAKMYRRAGKSHEELDWHLESRSLRPSPGSSFRGPVRELGKFYEAFLECLRGERAELLSAESACEMIQRRREGEFDKTLMHIVDMGYGFQINSNRYGAETVPYGFGRHASSGTFGHGGAQSSIGFADPKQQLAVAVAFNTMAGEPRHNQRNREVNSAIYQDLGLAES